MRQRKLQDRVYRGLGICARQTGELADAFRVCGSDRPLRPENRFLRLYAGFEPSTRIGAVSETNQQVIWQGLFDGSYTQPGDYISALSGTYFIASQAALQPIFCVKTNRIVSIHRPTQVSQAAPTIYSAYSPTDTTQIISGFPAAIVSETRSGSISANLPTGQPAPFLYVLLPAPVDVVFAQGDFITDDLKRTAVVANADLTETGWRLHAKIASA